MLKKINSGKTVLKFPESATVGKERTRGYHLQCEDSDIDELKDFLDQNGINLKVI
jgi:hypothetical protein